MNDDRWTHARQVVTILGGLGILFLGILAIRDNDKNQLLAALASLTPR